jgi:hypothetical protein
MAEIKSTLDLVMERTKHLSFSEEEKEAQQTKEIQSAFRGMIQKYQDNAFTREELQIAVERSREKFGLKNDALLLGDILGRIDLSRDNQLLLDLIGHLLGIEVSGLTSIIGSYGATVRSGAQARADSVLSELATSHQISGTAVRPSLEADAQWSEEHQAIFKKFHQDLAREKARIQDAYI